MDKQLNEINRTLESIKTFTIAEAQLLKAILLELKIQSKEIKLIKKTMEEK